jgi:hypothetical protein
MAGLKAEGAVLGTVDDGDTEKTPVMIRTGDGTCVAAPEYADEDGDQDQQHHDAPPAIVVGLSGVKAGSRAHKLMMLKFHMACEIIDFKHDVKELIVDYLFDPIMDDDERVRLLYVALDDDEPRPRGDDDNVEQQQVNHQLDEQGRLTVSAAGFVDVLHMRRCIKAFFDPYMADVQDEDADEGYDRNFWVNFMAATGFVNRLWDLRRIIDVYLDAKLDLETRKTTIMARLADLVQLLQTRANAVATGEFNLLI